jgi:sensor domain CHASE-containing protein
MEEQDYITIVFNYLDKAPGWVLWLLFVIFFIILMFLLREFCCWLFRDNERIELMKEQISVLNKIDNNLYILTQRTVSNGYKRDDEKDEP